MKTLLKIVLVLLVLLLSCQKAEAKLTFIEGTHLIDYDVFAVSEWGNVGLKGYAQVIIAPEV